MHIKPLTESCVISASVIISSFANLALTCGYVQMYSEIEWFGHLDFSEDQPVPSV